MRSRLTLFLPQFTLRSRWTILFINFVLSFFFFFFFTLKEVYVDYVSLTQSLHWGLGVALFLSDYLEVKVYHVFFLLYLPWGLGGLCFSRVGTPVPPGSVPGTGWRRIQWRIPQWHTLWTTRLPHSCKYRNKCQNQSCKYRNKYQNQSCKYRNKYKSQQ